MPDLGGAPNREMPGYLVDAVGVRSTPNGYRGMPTFSDVANASAVGSDTDFGYGVNMISAGSTFIDGSTGEAYQFPGDSYFYFINAEGEIYTSANEGDSWSEATPSTGDTLDPFGDFIQFGSIPIYVCGSRVPICSNGLGQWPMQDLSTISSGTPPTATCGARVGKHVVLGNGVTIQTSAIGSAVDWPTPGTAAARAKQCITETLDLQYGAVRRILGGEKIGIVVQDSALTRMTYVGGSSVFTFDTYERTRGSGFNQYSRFATDGKLWYWYNDQGFFATDGYSVTSLSAGKVDEAIFLDSLSHENGDLGTAQTVVYDSRRSLVIAGSRQGGQDQLCYNVKDGNFSFLRDADVMALIGGISETSRVPAVYNIDATSRFMQILGGGSPTIAMQTGYIELDPGYRFQFQGAHLLGNGGGSLTLAYKTAASESACDMTQTGFTSLTAAGLGQKKTARASAQYIAFRVAGTGAESHLYKGIRVYYERAEPSP
jgi:hypothetical protein